MLLLGAAGTFRVADGLLQVLAAEGDVAFIQQAGDMVAHGACQADAFPDEEGVAAPLQRAHAVLEVGHAVPRVEEVGVQCRLHVVEHAAVVAGAGAGCRLQAGKGGGGSGEVDALQVVRRGGIACFVEGLLLACPPGHQFIHSIHDAFGQLRIDGFLPGKGVEFPAVRHDRFQGHGQRVADIGFDERPILFGRHLVHGEDVEVRACHLLHLLLHVGGGEDGQVLLEEIRIAFPVAVTLHEGGEVAVRRQGEGAPVRQF